MTAPKDETDGKGGLTAEVAGEGIGFASWAPSVVVFESHIFERCIESFSAKLVTVRSSIRD